MKLLVYINDKLTIRTNILFKHPIYKMMPYSDDCIGSNEIQGQTQIVRFIYDQGIYTIRIGQYNVYKYV